MNPNNKVKESCCTITIKVMAKIVIRLVGYEDIRGRRYHIKETNNNNGDIIYFFFLFSRALIPYTILS